MKIVVLGSGAMGCVYGGKLAEAGYEVTLVDIWFCSLTPKYDRTAFGV